MHVTSKCSDQTAHMRRPIWSHSFMCASRDGSRELFVWFDSLRPINNLSVKQGRVFLGWTSTKLYLVYYCVLLKDHNAVTLVRLEPAAPRSQVKHSTTALPGSREDCIDVQLGSSEALLFAYAISTKSYVFNP